MQNLLNDLPEPKGFGFLLIRFRNKKINFFTEDLRRGIEVVLRKHIRQPPHSLGEMKMATLLPTMKNFSVIEYPSNSC